LRAGGQAVYREPGLTAREPGLTAREPGLTAAISRRAVVIRRAAGTPALRLSLRLVVRVRAHPNIP
jgi:hypothetical protein